MGHLLRWQAHTARADQAGIRRLEAPEGPADRALEIDVLIVGAAEGEVGGRSVVVRYRHKAQNYAARVDFQHPAERGRRHPQITLDVVMDAIGSSVSGHKGPGLHTRER